MKSRRSLRAQVVTAAALAALVPLQSAMADGTFDGGQVSLPQMRDWMFPGPNPGINWTSDILPLPGVDALAFTSNGDGGVMLGGIVHAQPSIAFSPWTTYGLFGGTVS